jgi:hypothetical protein
VEELMVIATVVSAVAALGALRFARDTVHETRELRREDRLARLPELVAEFGESLPGVGAPTLHYTIPRKRLAALLAPLEDPLPNCRLLATGAEFDDSGAFRDHSGTKRVEEVTVAALDELAELMRSEAPREPVATAVNAQT